MPKYTLKEWIEQDEERVLEELTSMLEKQGVKIGNMNQLRYAVDKMESLKSDAGDMVRKAFKFSKRLFLLRELLVGKLDAETHSEMVKIMKGERDEE